jgi:hypothetical protein
VPEGPGWALRLPKARLDVPIEPSALPLLVGI